MVQELLRDRGKRGVGISRVNQFTMDFIRYNPDSMLDANLSDTGQFLFAPGTATEDEVMTVALDAGADDVIVDEEGGIEVVCDPQAFEAVNDAFEKAGMKPEMAEVTMKALNETSLSGEDAERMQRLIDALEDLDDVQQVYTTAVFED